MPNDNIRSAPSTRSANWPAWTYEDFLIEGYGQAGVALLVEELGQPRTARCGVRHVFQKNGGTMARWARSE
jgi:transcriptional/translational regulatory protein YebC/TACO1